jgi:uracil-DNA glycosylase
MPQLQAQTELGPLLAEVRACRLCAGQLDPRPVLRLTSESRVLVIGQAPGSRVHQSGLPWDDASGDNLREWLGVDRATFDDPSQFGLLPMAFCYPGKGASGDLPPPAVCAQTWHGRLQACLRPQLTLLVGQYAQAAYLGDRRESTLTETVERFDRYAPLLFPLPHPSWRSRGWAARNPWFGETLLPALRLRVADALAQA